jgi:hypothetical protein
MTTHPPAESKRSRLAIVLTLAMVFAMVMGPGPGVRFINPDIHDPSAAFLIGQVPVIYLWGVFWFAVQAAILTTAYFTIWRTGPHTEHRTEG